ncbi:MAG TPA: radical SAM protein, partial [Syntrophales bacterium]|nr:radical SAM protein [Syntrophales bacterium]
DSIDFLFKSKAIRSAALARGEKMLYQHIVVKNEDNRPWPMQTARAKLIQNLLRTIDEAFGDGRISFKPRKAIIGNLVGRVIMDEKNRTDNFRSTYGFFPPFFLAIAPTKKCNLMCTGCYAASSSKDAETLKYDVFNRILREKKDLWGSYFTVITGGEPLLYRDSGKSLFDVLEDNSDNFFMMYTNGTLITKDIAKRIAEYGNLTPAISVEGFQKETDDRRGIGTHKRIMAAMENLRNAGVPFGVSITVTQKNAHIALRDDFVELYFKDQGALYGWIFQYMPIGRGVATDLMITPSQRLDLFKREQELIQETDLFLVDFWNGGLYSIGCISAGRPGGYFYIDWSGNIAPCVFMPYYKENIYDLYREDKTLNDVLFAPYFKAIRNWQNDYAYTQPPNKVGNLIAPCFFRDHFDMAYETIKHFQVEGLDKNATAAINDHSYCSIMSNYGRSVQNLTDEIWQEEFTGSYRQNVVAKKDNISSRG